MKKVVKEFKIVDKKYLLIIYENGNNHVINLEQMFGCKVKSEVRIPKHYCREELDPDYNPEYIPKDK